MIQTIDVWNSLHTLFSQTDIAKLLHFCVLLFEVRKIA